VDDPHRVFTALLAQGILIRDVGIPHHLRVTAGTRAETTMFLAALSALTDDDALGGDDSLGRIQV